MAAILTSVMAAILTFVNADTLAEKPIESLIAAQHKKNIETCTQNLVAIGNAIGAYKKEHGDFPDWLSDLHPKYLADVNTLICPADEEEGKTSFAVNTDPKMPVSYGYQFHPEYRGEKSTQREMYGDIMPLVRCRHHANEDFACLNLSFSSKIYKSSAVWELTLEDLYGSLKHRSLLLRMPLRDTQMTLVSLKPIHNLSDSILSRKRGICKCPYRTPQVSPNKRPWSLSNAIRCACKSRAIRGNA